MLTSHAGAPIRVVFAMRVVQCGTGAELRAILTPIATHAFVDSRAPHTPFAPLVPLVRYLARVSRSLACTRLRSAW